MKRFPIVLGLVSAVLAAPAWAAQDHRKTSTALLSEASRLEGEREYVRAIEKAEKAVEKAFTEGRKDVAARALQVVGRCTEMQTPENLDKARTAYEKIVAECGDVEGVSEWAKLKVAWRGVDVHLNRYDRALDRGFVDGRRIDADIAQARGVLTESDPRMVELRKKAAEIAESAVAARKELLDRIQPLGKDASPGLIAGLSHKNALVALTAAEFLADLIDEAGVVELIARLGDDRHRPGAALGLNRVFVVYAAARRYEDDAMRMKEELTQIKVPSAEGSELDPKVKERVEAVKAGVEKSLGAAETLTKKATETRRNLPETLNTSQIQDALRSVLTEAKSPASAIEAAKALESVGALSGPLVDALLEGLAKKDRNVRRACCVAAGAVETTNAADKRRLADRLREIVKYEPEKEYAAEKQNEAEVDFANDAVVRQAAALSLGRIGAVRAIPELIDALEDNAPQVREAAHHALKEMTGLDLGYESEPHIQDAGLKEADPKSRTRMPGDEKRKQQMELRKKGIDAWTAWWSETHGVATVVARFWRFQGAWQSGDPTRLFDKSEYMRDARNSAYALVNPQDALATAERIVDRFQKRKDFMEEDALEGDEETLPRLLNHLSGKVELLEKGLSVEVQAKGRAATRLFVAETAAKLIAKARASDKLAELREKIASGAKDEQAGAALVFGFLPKEMVGGPEREVLDRRGLESGEWEVREASARSLARVGSAENVPGLTRVATNLGDNERVQLWALRAIGAIRAATPDAVKALGELVGQEEGPEAGASRKSPNTLVRATGCDTLGELGNADAIRNLHLLRARRDLALPVRQAAQQAIRAIAASDAAVGPLIAALLRGGASPEGRSGGLSSADRVGAALALGDLADEKYATALLSRVVDQNPPTVMRDDDASVRAAACRGLGSMGEKARFKEIGEGLVAALGSDGSEQVRRDGYAALAAIAGAAPPPFDPSGTTEFREGQLREIRSWWSSQGWRSAPQ